MTKRSFIKSLFTFPFLKFNGAGGNRAVSYYGAKLIPMGLTTYGPPSVELDGKKVFADIIDQTKFNVGCKFATDSDMAEIVYNGDRFVYDTQPPPAPEVFVYYVNME